MLTKLRFRQMWNKWVLGVRFSKALIGSLNFSREGRIFSSSIFTFWHFGVGNFRLRWFAKKSQNISWANCFQLPVFIIFYLNDNISFVKSFLTGFTASIWQVFQAGQALFLVQKVIFQSHFHLKEFYCFCSKTQSY